MSEVYFSSEITRSHISSQDLRMDFGPLCLLGRTTEVRVCWERPLSSVKANL